jgi:hypothetical protein
MIYAMSSKIIVNEGRQAREEPSILKLPVNISTDRCRTRRCGLREGGQLLNKPAYGVRPNNTVKTLALREFTHRYQIVLAFKQS